MNRCSRETEVLRSPDSYKNHWSACASCREALTVTRYLQSASASPVGLPDASMLWFRGKLLQRWALEERATKSLTRVESLGQAASLLVPVAFLVWKWPALKSAFAQTAPAVFEVWNIAGLPSVLTWVLILAGSIAMTALFALQAVLREE